jgi:hypothetical protein
MMKHLKTICSIALVALHFIFGISAGYGDGVLPIPEVIQSESNWCWAACSRGIMMYYGVDWSQCEIAHVVRACKEWGIDDCCLNPGSMYCNQPNYAIDTLPCGIPWVLVNMGGLNGYNVGGPHSKSSIVSYINAGKPFMMGWSWPGGGGHALVGRGIVGNNVYYINPAQGYGYQVANYDWVVSAPNHHQ